MQNRLKYNACHWFMNCIGQENQTEQNDPKPKKPKPQQQTVAIEKLKQLALVSNSSLYCFLQPFLKMPNSKQLGIKNKGRIEMSNQKSNATARSNGFQTILIHPVFFLYVSCLLNPCCNSDLSLIFTLAKIKTK